MAGHEHAATRDNTGWRIFGLDFSARTTACWWRS